MTGQHPSRCETCDYRYDGEDGTKCPYDREEVYYLLKKEMSFPRGAWLFTSVLGCASHSSFKCAQEQIKLGERRTCEYQEIKTYPADEFIYCKSLEKCEFQCPESIGDAIFCDKPVITHDAVIEQSARKDERDKVLDEAISLINKNCFELEGKRLKITPLLLLQEIDKLRQV